jgi:hypothetical protein
MALAVLAELLMDDISISVVFIWSKF